MYSTCSLGNPAFDNHHGIKNNQWVVVGNGSVEIVLI